MIRFTIPINSRKTPETPVPISPPTLFSWPLALITLLTTNWVAKPSASAIRNTTVE